MTNNKYSLKTILFVLSGLLITFTTVIITWYHYHQSSTMLMKEFDNRAEIIAKSLGYQSYEGIIVQDPYIFNQICQGILQEKNIIYTMVYDRRGILIYKQFTEGFNDLVNVFPKNLKRIEHLHQPIKKHIVKFKQNSRIFNLLDIRRVVKDKDNRQKIIGYVRIGVGLNEIKALKKRLIFNSFLISLIILGVGLVSSFRFSKTLSKSLSVLVDAMRNIIQSHELSEQIKQKSKIIEVDEIQTYFNNMIENLKEARAEFEASEQKYRTMVATASKAEIGIAVIQNDGERKGVFKYVNQGVSNLSGYSREELLKMTIKDIIHPDNLNKVWKMFAKKPLGNESSDTYQFWGIKKKREKIPIEISTGVTEFDGKKALVCYARDITEKLKAEEQLRNYSQNLEKMVYERTAELKKTLTDLQNTQSQLIQSEKMASIGQLAAGVAHEINNPIGFVKSNLGTMNEYREDLTRLFDKYQVLENALQQGKNMSGKGAIQKAIENIQEVKDEIDISFILDDYSNVIDESIEGMARVAKIVADLKDFAHVDKAELEHTDINKGIESTLNIVWNELKYKAEVIKDLGNIPPVKCYPQRINQVFMNVLVNAAQAIEKKGEIRIVTRAVDGLVQVEISDTGVGIPEENLSKIFDPFFTTKEVGKGTGLGLNMAYNIIQKHKGTIELKSEVGEGTTFIIRLQVEPDLDE